MFLDNYLMTFFYRSCVCSNCLSPQNITDCILFGSLLSSMEIRNNATISKLMYIYEDLSQIMTIRESAALTQKGWN